MATQSIGNLLTGIGTADPSGGGRGRKIMIKGRHRVRIKAIRSQDSQKTAGTFYIVEYTVLETTANAVTDADRASEAAQKGHVPMPVFVGEDYSWSHNILNKWFGASRLKQFLIAATGIDDTLAAQLAQQGGADLDPFWMAIADWTLGIPGKIQQMREHARRSGNPNPFWEIVDQLSPSNPFEGLELIADTDPIVPDTGNPMTVYTWSAVA